MTATRRSGERCSHSVKIGSRHGRREKKDDKSEEDTRRERTKSEKTGIDKTESETKRQLSKLGTRASTGERTKSFLLQDASAINAYVDTKEGGPLYGQIICNRMHYGRSSHLPDASWPPETPIDLKQYLCILTVRSILRSETSPALEPHQSCRKAAYGIASDPKRTFRSNMARAKEARGLFHLIALPNLWDLSLIHI